MTCLAWFYVNHPDWRDYDKSEQIQPKDPEAPITDSGADNRMDPEGAD